MPFVMPDWAAFAPPSAGQVLLLKILRKAEIDGIPNRLEPGRVEPETLHIEGKLIGNAWHLDPLYWRKLAAPDRNASGGPVVIVTDEGRGLT